MKRWSCYLSPFILVLVSSASAASAEFEVKGRRVAIRTDRFLAAFEDLSLVRLENRLTGEVYAEGAGPARSDFGTLASMCGIGVHSLRPAVPMYHYLPCERSVVEAKRTSSGVSISCRGLEAATQDGTDFAKDMVFRLELTVDPATGDLLIATSATGNIEAAHDIRDRGVAEAGILLPALAEDLRLVLPVAGGISLGANRVPEEWAAGEPVRLGWPREWEAALFIGEGSTGSFGLWADEPALDYGRRLALCQENGRWQAALAFETTGAIYQCDEVKGPRWRLNVFDGNWLAPARRYREQMHAQWPETKQSSPDWAHSVQVVVAGLPAESDVISRYLELVPPETLAVFSAEGWRPKADPDTFRSRLGSEHVPPCLLTRGERAEDFGQRVRAVEKAGVRVFVPHSPVHVTSTLWERMFPETAVGLARELGVRGVFQDASWAMQRRIWSRDVGRNPYNGFGRLQEYWRSLAPELGWMGERASELSARGQQFALDVARLPECAHPVSAFLLGSAIHTWNLAPTAASLDADDTRGWLTTWPAQWVDEPRGIAAMLRQRGRLFAQRQLQSRWPDQWEPNVLHYWRGSDGAEYRSVRDRGTRFVRIADGREETLWWRVHGTREVAAPGMGVLGWAGYDGDRVLGLNPEAVYFPEREVPRPPASICKMPEDVAIECCVLREGFWCVRLRSLQPDSSLRPAVIGLRSGQNVKVHGAKKVAPKGEGRTDVTVTVPGGFAVSWGKAQPIGIGQDLSKLPVPISFHDLSSGALVRTVPSFEEGPLAHEAGAAYRAQASVCWLVEMPIDKAALTFQYGSEATNGDGANYYVRVNGQTIWQAYREEGQGEGKKKPKAKPKPEEAEIDLSAYLLKTIVIELATDGHRSAVQDQAVWHQPKLKAKEKGGGPDLMEDVGL